MGFEFLMGIYLFKPIYYTLCNAFFLSDIFIYVIADYW